VKLICGLGNPGQKYASTRHNIGFMVVEALALESGIILKRGKNKSLTGRGSLNGRQVILAKPQTFMNLCGEAIAPLLFYYSLDTSDLIVIHDDIDLEFGRVKIKSGGGHGGHNGVKSLMSHLGGGDFVRLRIGVGRSPCGEDVSGYVLSPFSAEQKKEIHNIIERASDAAVAIVTDGPGAAMNRFN